MNSQVIKLISDETNSFVKQIRENLQSSGTNATGETSSSLYSKIDDDGQKVVIEVFGRPYFGTVETGRRPTPDKKPSRGMVENIKVWLAARNKPEEMAWAVAFKINKEGTELWKKGGRKDIYSEPRDAFVKAISDAVAKEIADELVEQTAKAFK